MPGYYSVKKNKDGTVDIESNNPTAKQALWSWAGDYGSTHDEGAIELYGTDTPYGGPGDRKRWRWHLTPKGIASVTRSFQLQLADPKKYDSTPAENACARELLKKLGVKSAGGKKRHGSKDFGPREAAAFIKGKIKGARVRFLADDGVPRLGTVVLAGDPGWMKVRTDNDVAYNIHVGSILQLLKPAPRGGKRRRAGGKARHPGNPRLARSFLRPFAVYCGGCHRYLSGKEHVWHDKAYDKYYCDACGGGAGGGKKRHGHLGPYCHCMHEQIHHADGIGKCHAGPCRCQKFRLLPGTGGGKKRHAGVGKLAAEVDSMLRR
jgi:hypothetical protein